MAQLVIMLDKQIVKRFSLRGPTYTLGRRGDCDVVLPDRTISGRHARLTLAQDDCFLEDMRSTNGTYVNHQHVERCLLEDGDIIGLGKYHLVFRSKQGIDAQIRRLGIHPKLLDPSYPAWLAVMNGRKSGYFIPLDKPKISLGSYQSGSVVVECTANGEYLIHQGGGTLPRTTRTLQEGEVLKIADISLQFCLKNEDENDPSE